jgi:hypothetical protein
VDGRGGKGPGVAFRYFVNTFYTPVISVSDPDCKPLLYQ